MLCNAYASLAELSCLVLDAVIQIPLKVAADAYIKTLMAVEDELLVKVNIIAEVEKINERFSDELSLTFQYPPLKVEVRSGITEQC